MNSSRTGHLPEPCNEKMKPLASSLEQHFIVGAWLENDVGKKHRGLRYGG